MSRLSIEISPENHHRLKAAAALLGKSIKDYVLKCALPPVAGDQSMSEKDALLQLKMFLKPRIELADRGNIVSMSVKQIFEDTSDEVSR